MEDEILLVEELKHKNIMFFDGDCNLCNRTVRFYMKRNKKKTMYFSSLQSITGQAFLKDNQLSSNNFDTIYLYSKGELFCKSTAILRGLAEIDRPYSLLKVFTLIPVKFRDMIYDVISRHRLRIFRNQTKCNLINADLNNIID